MTEETYESRKAKLLKCLEIAERVGNTFLKANVQKALREAEAEGRDG